MNKPITSVIIVNYNVTEELTNCVNSLNSFYNNNTIEIIVIDNNSPDRSIEDLIKKYPNVKFILKNENLGYSKANNLVANESIGEYLLFLNPDTIIIDDFISPIIDFITGNSNAGACGPMLIYKDQKFQSSTGIKMGCFYEMLEAFMLIEFWNNISKWLISSKYQQTKPFKVNWLSGACLLMKKNVFMNAGMFDTGYFMNYEDIDLCNKIEKNGYTNFYFPYLKCIHLNQVSQKKNWANLVISRYQSRLIYAKLHYSKYVKVFVRIIHIFGLLLRIPITLFIYSGREGKQRLTGYLYSLKLYLNIKSL